jgi:hypothetical protein
MTMAGINDYDCEGTLTIASVSMNRAAWAVLGDDTGQGGLLNLWVYTEQRGSDRIVPSAAGAVAYRRRETVTRHDLRLMVVGDVDENGTATANSLIGLAANINYLESNVIQPTNTGDGTRAATLTVPGQSTRSANIHVLGFQPQEYHLGDTQAILVGTLQISIPAGRFA